VPALLRAGSAVARRRHVDATTGRRPYRFGADGRGQLLGLHICQRRKINLSQVFAGQKVGVKQTADHIWLVSFMEYELGVLRRRDV
jgi:hypothetical protein